MCPTLEPPEEICGEVVEHIRRHPTSGVFYARKSVKGHGQVTVSLGRKHFRSASEARRIRDERLAEATGKPVGKRVSCEFAAKMAAELKTQRGVRTQEEFVYTWSKRLRYFWKNIPVDDVIKRWPEYVKLQETQFPDRKLDRDAKIMRFILGVAAENKWIPPLPLPRAGERLLEVPEGHREAKKPTPYDTDEISKLYSVANGKWQLIFDLALHGVRQGSIRTLKWEYVDFEHGELVIPGKRVKQGTEWRVALDKSVLDRLGELKRKSQSAFIFPRRDDLMRPMSRNSKQFYRLRDLAGLKKTFHTFRHTVASELVRRGHHSVFIKKQLKMSEKTLEGVYTHLSREDRREMSADAYQGLRKIKENGK
jgi:integrase